MRLAAGAVNGARIHPLAGGDPLALKDVAAGGSAAAGLLGGQDVLHASIRKSERRGHAALEHLYCGKTVRADLGTRHRAESSRQSATGLCRPASAASPTASSSAARL